MYIPRSYTTWGQLGVVVALVWFVGYDILCVAASFVSGMFHTKGTYTHGVPHASGAG